MRRFAYILLPLNRKLKNCRLQKEDLSSVMLQAMVKYNILSINYKVWSQLHKEETPPLLPEDPLADKGRRCSRAPVLTIYVGLVIIHNVLTVPLYFPLQA